MGKVLNSVDYGYAWLLSGLPAAGSVEPHSSSPHLCMRCYWGPIASCLAGWVQVLVERNEPKEQRSMAGLPGRVRSNAGEEHDLWRMLPVARVFMEAELTLFLLPGGAHNPLSFPGFFK